MTTTRGQHLIGKVFGSCVLEKLLGYGGSSAVFLAQRLADAPFTSERKVAVKVFLPRAGSDDQMRIAFYQRFLHEVKAVSKLEHANILPIYAYGEQEGLPYIVMPYMPGGTLSAYMAKRGPLSLRETCWYLQQLADALDYAHQQGCVHCDVKPANVLLDRDGYVMLTDFGIARIMRDQADAESSAQGKAQLRHQLRRQESVLGTPDYASPEQVQMRPLDGRSDIYSLGVMLFYVLTRQLPFQADTLIALVLLHVYKPPPSLMTLRADITPALDRVVQTALAKQPDDRYQSAGALSAAFVQALAESEQRKLSVHTSSRGLRSDGKLLTGPQPTLLTPPMTRRRSRAAHTTPLQRFWLACLILCCVLASVCVVFAVIARQQQSTLRSVAVTPSPRVVATPFPTSSFVRDWPHGPGFFVDAQQRYHIINSQTSGAALAFDMHHQVQDFQGTITLQEIRTGDDADYQGIVFRVSADVSHYYMFAIAPRDDSYEFVRYDDKRFHYLLTGNFVFPLQRVNTLAVIAQKNTFQFIVNGHAVTQHPLQDTEAPLLAGLFGLYLENEGEVAFSRLSLQPR